MPWGYLAPFQPQDMGVSKNSGTPKSSIFKRVFHYKPSILGYPYFWKYPYKHVHFEATFHFNPSVEKIRRSSLCVATPTGQRFIWQTRAMIPGCLEPHPNKRKSSPSWEKKPDPQVQTDSFRVAFWCFLGVLFGNFKVVWLPIWNPEINTSPNGLEHQGYQGTSCYIARMGAWSAHRPFPWCRPQPPLQKS